MLKAATSYPGSIRNKLVSLICKLIGHAWHYQDYYNHINSSGNPYEFSQSRKCSRCKKTQYLYAEWKTETKNLLL